MKLLMHICCSNCSLYPLKSLLSKGIELKGFWFNPNIHPYPEYNLRITSLRRLQKLWDLDIEYEDFYSIDKFVKSIGDPENNRCLRCYALRLEETARTAKRMNLDGFTTSLLVSPYQKFEGILDVGREMARRYSVHFFEEDFRNGYRGSIPLSKELGLYRQKYCGCIFSDGERTRGWTSSLPR
ncbi:MAG TPA: epoxyqueuosine reductase QueH [Thermodesulfovibrionales bacterium]|nr:epoxyqueuosine reductase QueH [Thermodesulfovibrionales bacterium]